MMVPWHQIVVPASDPESGQAEEELHIHKDGPAKLVSGGQPVLGTRDSGVAGGRVDVLSSVHHHG